MPVKFQSDAIIYTTNLAASRLHKILQWDTSYQILKRCQDSDSIPIRFWLLTGGWFQLKSANSASTPAHGTRREKAMHQISHRNLWRYAQIFRDSRPPRQVSDTEMDVARPVSMALRNKVNFTNYATKLSQNYYTTSFRHFSGNEHPYSVICKSIFHEKLLQNSGIWRGNRVLPFSAFTLGMRGTW